MAPSPAPACLCAFHRFKTRRPSGSTTLTLPFPLLAKRGDGGSMVLMLTHCEWPATIVATVDPATHALRTLTGSECADEFGVDVGDALVFCNKRVVSLSAMAATIDISSGDRMLCSFFPSTCAVGYDREKALSSAKRPRRGVASPMPAVHPTHPLARSHVSYTPYDPFPVDEHAVGDGQGAPPRTAVVRADEGRVEFARAIEDVDSPRRSRAESSDDPVVRGPRSVAEVYRPLQRILGMSAGIRDTNDGLLKQLPVYECVFVNADGSETTDRLTAPQICTSRENAQILAVFKSSSAHMRVERTMDCKTTSFVSK